MKDMYNVSASPHIRRKMTTASIMRDVCIALVPASAFGIFQFGFKAFLVLLTSITSAVVAEFLWMKLMKKPKTPYECSALVTGLLLGMNLPASVPLWMPMVGSIFAIIVVKQLFGGLGQNFMNPALAARCFLLICFAGRMTDFAVEKGSNLFMNGHAAVDGLSSATPLAIVDGLSSTTSVASSVSLTDMLFGFTGGVIGETSAVALLIGAVYLMYKNILCPIVPLMYNVFFILFIIIFGGRGLDGGFIASQLLGGGFILGAFFMATDYVTCPVTVGGKFIYGALLGIMTGILRIFGNSSEGVSYAIIFCNLLVPLIEKWTIPKAFGREGKSNAN